MSYKQKTRLCCGRPPIAVTTRVVYEERNPELCIGLDYKLRLCIIIEYEVEEYCLHTNIDLRIVHCGSLRFDYLLGRSPKKHPVKRP